MDHLMIVAPQQIIPQRKKEDNGELPPLWEEARFG
jgi:hypothetical protein